MSLRGVLFDFNGVLLWDSPLHEEAWIDLATELRGYPLTHAEHALQVHGHTNHSIVEYLLGRKLTRAESQPISERKETLYRQRCIRLGAAYHLSPGAEQLFQRLTNLQAPFTIATASGESNVRFYFEHLGLGRWFSPERMAYDDGTLPGKPAPDLFLKAARLIGLSAAECIIVEDSLSGLQAAQAAGAGCIVALGPSSDHPALAAIPGVNLVVETLDQIPVETLIAQQVMPG